MIKAAITGKRQVKFIEMPMPKATGDWVLVKVHASALCTEYKSYLLSHDHILIKKGATKPLFVQKKNYFYPKYLRRFLLLERCLRR